MADRDHPVGGRTSLERPPHLFDQGLQGVAAAQDLRDDRRVQPQPAVARQVEQRLHLVREAVHRRQPEEPRVALDGVKRAEDRVQRLGIIRAPLQGEQRRLDLLQMLEGLAIKFRQQLAVLPEVELQQGIGQIHRRRRTGAGDGRRRRKGGRGGRRQGRAAAPGRQRSRQPFDEDAQAADQRGGKRGGRVQAALKFGQQGVDGLEHRRLGRAQRPHFPEQAVDGNQPLVPPRRGEHRLHRQTVQDLLPGGERIGRNGHVATFRHGAFSRYNGANECCLRGQIEKVR